MEKSYSIATSCVPIFALMMRRKYYTKS